MTLLYPILLPGKRACGMTHFFVERDVKHDTHSFTAFISNSNSVCLFVSSVVGQILDKLARETWHEITPSVLIVSDNGTIANTCK